MTRIVMSCVCSTSSVAIRSRISCRRDFGAEMISWFALLSGQIFTPAAALGDGLLELDGEGLGDGDGIPGGMEPSGVGGRLELEPELDREPLDDAGCALRICVSNVVISSASAN